MHPAWWFSYWWHRIFTYSHKRATLYKWISKDIHYLESSNDFKTLTTYRKAQTELFHLLARRIDTIYCSCIQVDSNSLKDVMCLMQLFANCSFHLLLSLVCSCKLSQSFFKGMMCSCQAALQSCVLLLQVFVCPESCITPCNITRCEEAFMQDWFLTALSFCNWSEKFPIWKQWAYNSNLIIHSTRQIYEGEHMKTLNIFYLVIYWTLYGTAKHHGQYGVLTHDSYPDVQLFHSLLCGIFPSQWLQLLQWSLTSLLGVPDQVEESLLQN